MSSRAPRCSVQCPDTIKNVLKVLDLILMNLCEPGKKKSFKPIQDFYTFSAVSQLQIRNSEGKTVNKNCVKLMNQSLCSHRYKTAVKLLWILCQDIKVHGSYIFKTSMFTLNNLKQSNNEDFMWNLYRMLQKLGLLHRKEVQLEYLIHGIQHDVPDLYKRAKEMFLQCKTKSNIVDPIFEAYSNFLQNYECFDTLDNIQHSQAQLNAESMILQFKKLVASTGDWDIFVIKLVKMLEFCDHPEEIEEVLTKYVECNPNNVNAHIYLCVYLCNFSTDNEKITFNLEILANLCPSDERILLLLELRKNSAWKLEECVKLNFMFLDYPSNGGNVLAWQLLSHFLDQIKIRNYDDELKTIMSLWKSRRKCWHWLYFNPLQLTDMTECEYHLIQIKIKVLSKLDKDHEFIKVFSKKFPSLHISN